MVSIKHIRLVKKADYFCRSLAVLSRFMSPATDFLTQPAFWWGTGAGTVLSAFVAGGFSLLGTKKSDTRKIDQENSLDERKAAREQEERNKAVVFEAASNYATIVADVLVSVVDEKKIFNFIRDAFLSENGEIDPNAMEKIAFAETQVSEMKRLSLSLSNLKLFASTELMDAAVRVYQSLRVVVEQTAQPMTKAAALQATGVELDRFMQIFRAERGLAPYVKSDAERASAGYMETLKEQVAVFRREAEEQTRSAGRT